VAWVLSQHENEVQDKRVESVWFPCADEGSTPSSSTNVMIMKAIRFTLFAIVMSALSGLTSCEKAVFDEEGSKTTEESQQETNQEDSTVSKVTLVLKVDVTRAAENSLPWKTLQFEVLDGLFRSVVHIKQSVDDENCGTASVELAPGTYYVAVLAHSLIGEPQINNTHYVAMFSKNDCSDVFYAFNSNVIVGKAGGLVELKLHRVTSLIRFHSKDVIPQEVKSVIVRCSGGSQSINLLDGYGVSSENQTLSFNVTDSMRGKPLEVDFYTIKVSKKNEVNFNISAYKSELGASVISSYKTKEYTIPITHGRISDCSAYFFTDGSDDPEINTGGGDDGENGNENETKDGTTSFVVKVDTAWAGIDHYEL